MMTLYVALFWKRGRWKTALVTCDFPVGIGTYDSVKNNNNQWLIVVCVRLTSVFCVGLCG